MILRKALLSHCLHPNPSPSPLQWTLSSFHSLAWQILLQMEERERGKRRMKEGRELEVNTGSSTCKGILDVHVLVGMNMCAASSHLVHCGHVSTHL